MTTRNYRNLLLLATSIALAGCQTTSTAPPSDIPQIDNIVTLIPDIPDSDGDDILDDIDECPQTPLHTVVDRRGCPFTLIGVGLKMEYRAFFAKGSSELSKEYQLDLDKVAKKLQEYYTATMRIEGHASADEISANDKALQLNSLARNRALIVKNYLIMQHKIEPERLDDFSYGANQPIASSDTEEGKSMNRRVYGIATADFDSKEEMSMHRRVYGLAQEP